MATFYSTADVDISMIAEQKICVIGYGSQGHAQALNLLDRGLNVRVALHATSKSKTVAQEAGFVVMTVAEATDWADILVFCTPDVQMSEIYVEGVEPHLRPGQMLLFAHGFNIHYKLIVPPSNVDVAMISPKGPGQGLRAQVKAGSGLPALIAVHQDATGTAFQRALAYGWAIGCSEAGILQTTFREETETDLFGEQTVLCGGISELVKAGFETLVEAGYQPEAAYFECLHETKLIVDLLYEGGLSYMHHAISDTAEWGDYVAGKKVINSQSRQAMKDLLREIQDGTFAREWIQEHKSGRKVMEARRKEERESQVEKVGQEIRARIPFIKDKKVPE